MRLFVRLILLTTLSFAQSDVGVDSLYEATSQKNKLTELRNELDYIFNDPNFSNALWGVAIQSLKTGESIYNRNAEKLFQPASLVKLFTTSTALLLLGSDYKFKTKFYTDGKISSGILEGNLFILGGGDPTIKSARDDSTNDNFAEWIDSLNRLGIYSIKGDIIANDNLFAEDKFGKGWLNEYQSTWFAPPTGAFCLNNNSYEIFVSPSKLKTLAEINFNPTNVNFEFFNKVITEKNDTKLSISTVRKGNNIIQLTGSIPIDNEPEEIFIPVENPTHFFLNTFYEALINGGIEVAGYPVTINELNKKFNEKNLFFLFEHKSAQLSEIVSETNKNSNNFYAEQILKTIGLELYGYGSTENGIKSMRELLEKMGINPNNFKITDGSGLSTFNLITPKQVINLLSYLYKSDEFDSFYKSLAIAGYDGTLSERMKETEAENNFRGKSGFLENVRGLAGYIKTADNEPLVVTLIVNNFLVPSQLANYTQDKVCNRLANFTR